MKTNFSFSRGCHHRWLAVAWALLLLGSVACEQASGEAIFNDQGQFETEFAEQSLRLELAITPEQKQRGLMNRESLDADAGMLFIFPKPQRLSFWMRNTSIPLDIGYFDRNGVLREIYPLHPYDEQPVPSRSAFLQIALEVNQGWFREHGILPGTRLDMDRVKAAIRAAGHDPAEFNFGSFE